VGALKRPLAHAADSGVPLAAARRPMSLHHTSLLVCALAPLALAQSTPPPLATALPMPPVPIHGGADDEGIPYGLWAATESYKAGFAGDVTFVPYLGPNAPHSRPVAWRSRSVRIGEHELMTREHALRRQGQWRYELDFGGVVETWDVLPHGLEQSFVIAARPAAAGDLVVTGRITSSLHAPETAAAHRALELSDAGGAPIVRYGEAWAFDAAGARLAATTAHHDGVVELRVPASWLAAAVFPVVVDPLLTRVTISPGLPPESIDVARDDTGNDLMTVYTRAVSAGDHDAFAVMTDDAFGAPVTVFTDASASWSTPLARVAVAANPQTYCVVIERHLPDRRVRAHLHASGDTTLSTASSLIAGTAGQHDWRPDVGGQVLSTSAFTSTGNRFMVVWQRDVPPGGVFQNTAGSAIFGRTIDATGVLGTEFPIALGVLSLQDHEFPCVNQQARRTGSASQRSDWMVVCQRYIGSGATWRTMGKLVSDAGTVQSGEWLSTGSDATQHRLTPNVAGQTGRYLVSYVATPFASAPFQTTATTGHAWAAERVDWTPGNAPTNHDSRMLEGPHAQPDLRLGSAAYDTTTQSHWAITAQSEGGGGTREAFVARTGFQGLQTERRTLYAPASASEQGLAGGITFDSDADEFVVAFGRESSGSSGTVYGNRFAYVTPAALQTSGVACSSATIAWNGSQQIGAQFPGVALANAPATVPAILAVSFGTLDLNLTFLGMNGCRLLVDSGAPNFLGTVTAVTSASGNASIPLPLPEPLAGADLWFQWFHFDLGANPLNLVSTQRLRVEIVK
jgi:hypothetical protein